MKLDLESLQTESVTDNKIYNAAKIILASLFILLALAYLLSTKKTKRIAKVPETNAQIIESSMLSGRQRARLERSLQSQVSRKTFRFDLNDQALQNQEQEQQELLTMLRDQPKQSKDFYSLNQTKLIFLNNLETNKPQSLVYFDEQDLKQRKQRDEAIERKKKKKQQDQQLKLQQKEKKQDQSKRQDHSHKQSKKTIEGQKTKVQTQQKSTIGERKIFATVQPTNQIKPNQKINFTGITLGGKKASEDLKKEEENKKIPGKVQQKIPQAPKPTQFGQPPSLFGVSQGTGIESKGGLTGLFSNVNQPNILLQKSQPQAPQQQTKTQKSQQPATQLFTVPKQLSVRILPKPVEPKQTPVLPKPGQASTSQQSPVPQLNQSVLNPVSNLTKKDYLQKVIEYGARAKQCCQLKKTKINNFGRSISNLKELYQTATDFLNTINVGDQKEVETLATSIFEFLINKTIPSFPKQQGWEKFPSREKNKTLWKNPINTFVLKINLYRAMGHERIWLIIFGKLLKILDFIWKRQHEIKHYTDLQMVKNGYFSLQKQNDMALKYFTRLDLILYFLFCMTTLDPELVAQYLCQTANQDSKTYEQIKKLKYKWSYNYFWILVDAITVNRTKTYFKPLLYMNLVSSMYLQIRKNKINSTEFAEFDHLRKYIFKEGAQLTKRDALRQNKEIQALADIDEVKNGCKFDGQDFLGQIQRLTFYFQEKDTQYKKGIEQIEKRCSIFDFFKSQAEGK